MDSEKKITCLVTLHGIGFEQPPAMDDNGVELGTNTGYADTLHKNLLCTSLGPMLSDDPNRKREKVGDNGAIYVQSLWNEHGKKPASHEDGLKRLGIWSDDKTYIIQNDTSRLISDGDYASGKHVSHIALVYSNLEATGPAVGAALITLAMSVFSAARYASFLGLARLFVTDIKAATFRKQSTPCKHPVSSLPRKDMTIKHKRIEKPKDTSSSPGVLRTFRSLENDVACYICHNEERERVRSFVREALIRLAARHDVDQIILNTHSNGTVIAFDVLGSLPKEAVDKIKVFVTAGSPLRKYVNLFHWGTEFRCHYEFKPWYNFWDELDPVADPLEPPCTWRVRDKILSPYSDKLFRRIDPSNEESCWMPVEDRQVRNVEHSPDGGLKAHNYWDNKEQFARALADIVQGKVPEGAQVHVPAKGPEAA